MIEVDGLTKYYGRLPAIKDVKFRIGTGEIVGFLGPNGAGKTTTMRILTCYSPASSGEARVLGMDVRSESMKIRSKVGYLPENAPLYSWMRVSGYLDFVARAKRIPPGNRAEEIARVARTVGIEDAMTRLIGTLSKGYRQRVGLAQALLGDPPLLILDEPTIGLDPKQIREIRELIRSFSENRTVILSTHILPEVSQVCNRVIIINKGSIVAEDTPGNLTRRHGKSARCHLVIRAPAGEAISLLEGVDGVVSVEPGREPRDSETELTVNAKKDLDIRPALSRAVVEKGWDLLELTSMDASLEDVFIELVTVEEEGTGVEASSGNKEVA